MAYMFSNISLQSLDLSNFNTSKVTNMAGMFELISADIMEDPYPYHGATS